MKIVSIEPTPSPNTMKITLNESLPRSEKNNFNQKTKNDAPAFIQKLLEIEGVINVYHVENFIALDRNAKYDWKVILPKVREAFGEQIEKEEESVTSPTESFGDLKVFVQKFRGIPMQVKIEDGIEERRYGLPERFKEAAFRAQKAADNLIKERSWVEQGVRYGEPDEIAQQVIEELEAAYSDERLNELVEGAYKSEETRSKLNWISKEEVERAFESDDWKVRYAALEKMNPTQEDIPLLAKAIKDENTSIRRLATVYLGMIEDEAVLPYLYIALKDKSVTVRRTAGDCLSDIGSPKAIPEMIQALKDKNKLVRWRAAMFLYEVGDESALPALKEAEDDPEFEVSLQVKMAIERIESGEEAAGSVWQQMTNARKNK